jgi:polar amino acid transport system substrate-binding protein
LAENELQIDMLSQLAGLRIVAYQQAHQFLGAEFSRVVGQANYIEMAERRSQLELLFNQRVDLVIGERRVLQYLAAEVAPQQRLRLHSLFAQKHYPAACWQPRLTAILEQGIQQMAASGELEQVLTQFSLPDTSELR